MQEQHVEMVRAQPAQAGLEAFPETGDGEILRPVRRVAELADQDNVVPPAGQGFAQLFVEVDAQEGDFDSLKEALESSDPGKAITGTN